MQSLVKRRDDQRAQRCREADVSPGEGLGAGVSYLQHPAHPLEAVLLCGVWPLLSHDHDPLVMQDGHRKHGYSVGTDRKLR